MLSFFDVLDQLPPRNSSSLFKETIIVVKNMGESDDRCIKRINCEERNWMKFIECWFLLLLNLVALAMGTISWPILTIFYFLQGWSIRWLSFSLESVSQLLPNLSIDQHPMKKSHNILIALQKQIYEKGFGEMALNFSALQDVKLFFMD